MTSLTFLPLFSGLSANVYTGEHLIELQTVPRWYEAAIQGVLADGSTATNRIDSSFFTQTLSDTNVLGQLTGLRTPRGYEGGVTVDLGTVEQRLVNSLGSNRNMDVFLIAINQLNCFKKNASGHRPWGQVIFDADLRIDRLAMEQQRPNWGVDHEWPHDSRRQQRRQSLNTYAQCT
jgi:hypothetical protein